jgi:hypothetical protein
MALFVMSACNVYLIYRVVVSNSLLASSNITLASNLAAAIPAVGDTVTATSWRIFSQQKRYKRGLHCLEKAMKTVFRP